MDKIHQTSEKLGVSPRTVFFLAAEHSKPTTDVSGAYQAWYHTGAIVGWAEEFCEKTLETFGVAKKHEPSLFDDD